jgi:hypothetical protein
MSGYLRSSILTISSQILQICPPLEAGSCMEAAPLCAICMGASGRPLSGKRCTANPCKQEYTRRLKAAKTGESAGDAAAAGSAVSPLTLPASPSSSVETVTGFTLWEIGSVFGQREFDPSKFNPFELRNGPAQDKEKELEYLVYAHWREGLDDVIRSPPPPSLSMLPPPQLARAHRTSRTRMCTFQC